MYSSTFHFMVTGWPWPWPSQPWACTVTGQLTDTATRELKTHGQDS